MTDTDQKIRDALRQRLAKVLEQNPTAAAITELLQAYGYIEIDNQRDPELAAMLRRACDIADDDQDGTVITQWRTLEGVGHAIYEIDMVGGPKAVRGELIKAIDAAIKNLMEDFPNDKVTIVYDPDDHLHDRLQ